MLGKPVLVPASKVTGLGSAIFAFLAAGTFRTVEEAQERVCPAYRTFTLEAYEQKIYEELYSLYRRVYFGFGRPGQANDYGDVLPKLIQIARKEP